MMSSSVNGFFELSKNKLISKAKLKELLPDVETALFFAKVFELDADRLGQLLRLLFKTPLVQALTEGTHSTELQDYLYEVCDDDLIRQVNFSVDRADIPAGEVLPALWKSAITEVADSIKKVAASLVNSIGRLPSKTGQMAMQSMMKMNVNRPTIGRHSAVINHTSVPDVLVILDVSGSMTPDTIRAIVDDVVALSWDANATLAIVSSHTYVWEPGSYSTEDVLEAAEYGGTVYETLLPLFDKDWGTVITIADYDSGYDAKHQFSKKPGRVGQVFDVSLVDRPTYLGECVGTLSSNVQSLIVAASNANLLRSW